MESVLQLQAFSAPVADDPGARVLLAGAGTSAYIGECLAPLLDRQLAARVDAIPTTDIVGAPALYLDPDRPLLLVSFGRSGKSPESLALSLCPASPSSRNIRKGRRGIQIV